mgnify:CR=1 FL=1
MIAKIIVDNKSKQVDKPFDYLVYIGRFQPFHFLPSVPDIWNSYNNPDIPTRPLATTISAGRKALFVNPPGYPFAPVLTLRAGGTSLGWGREIGVREAVDRDEGASESCRRARTCSPAPPPFRSQSDERGPGPGRGGRGRRGRGRRAGSA